MGGVGCSAGARLIRGNAACCTGAKIDHRGRDQGLLAPRRQAALARAAQAGGRSDAPARAQARHRARRRPCVIGHHRRPMTVTDLTEDELLGRGRPVLTPAAELVRLIGELPGPASLPSPGARWPRRSCGRRGRGRPDAGLDRAAGPGLWQGQCHLRAKRACGMTAAAFLSRVRLPCDAPIAASSPVLLPAAEDQRIGTVHRLL